MSSRDKHGFRNASRTHGLRRVAIGSILAVPLVFSTGCNEELWREFRSAAAAGLQTGIGTITEGFLQGAGRKFM